MLEGLWPPVMRKHRSRGVQAWSPNGTAREIRAKRFDQEGLVCGGAASGYSPFGLGLRKDDQHSQAVAQTSRLSAMLKFGQTYSP